MPKREKEEKGESNGTHFSDSVAPRKEGDVRGDPAIRRGAAGDPVADGPRSTRFAMKVSLSERAYVKLALHAAKHPTRDALGALVGRVKGEDLEVTDALPMTHTPLSVTPTVEIALEQFAHHASLDGDQNVVGLYLANERLGSLGLGPNVCVVADVIRNAAPNKNAIALVVDAEKLNDALLTETESTTEPKNHGLILMRRLGDGSTWETVGGQSGTVVVEPRATSSAKALFASPDATRSLVDFDDHLDDPARDWRNPGVDGMLAK